MIWWCIKWNIVGHLAEIEGKIDANQYMSILEEYILSSLEKGGISEEEVIFQWNNDLKNTSKKAKKWIKDKNITPLD